MEVETARVADYFVICGLNENSRPVNNINETHEGLSVSTLEYITDITAIRFDEKIPAEYVVRKQTVAGHRADFRVSEFNPSYFYLCYKKSRDLDGPVSPIAEIRVFLTENSLPRDFRLVEWHYLRKPVNFGSIGREVYLGYRTTILHAHTVAITDLTLISVDRGELPPAGFKRLKKNLDNHLRLQGKSKTHLCYKLAMPKPKAVFYTPEILSYYPTKEYPKDPLDRNILSFCMPAGVSIEVYDEDTLCPLPTSANFVFTREDGVKSYGVAVTLFEPVPDELRKSDMFKSLNVDASKKPNLFMSKAIVITSKWPFFSAFRTFLTTLYRISISKSTLPLERYIYNFMRGIPFPKPDGSKVMMQIGPESIFFSPPVNTLMPLNTAPFHTLLQCLNPKNIITLLHLVMLEQRIVLLSSVQSTLISVAESIQCLLYPFEWQTPYIPYILDTMTDMLDAPVPFIFGIHSLDFDVEPHLNNPSSEVSFVDLDSDYIYEGIPIKELTRLALPKGPCKSLRRRFTEIRQAIIGMGLSADDLAVDLAPINITARVEDQLARIDLLIQDAMLRFMIQLFNQYRMCLIQPTSVTIDHNECFNRKEFLRTMVKSERSFYTEFFDTQMFQKFIQDCFTDVDNKLNFFDVCIKKINSGEGKGPLIEYFQIHNDDAIVRTDPVSSEGLPPDVTYSYNTFPNLNMDYFPEDVKIQKDIVPTNFSQQLDATRVLKDAVKYKQDPYKWPRFLLGQCYSLWFLYLPTFIQNKSHNEQINIGNECLLLLEAIRSRNVLVTDEVAYLKLMEIGSEQRDLQLVQNIWKELERGNTESSTNLFTLYSKALENCYTRRAQLRWKKSILAILFCVRLHNTVNFAGGSPFSKSLAPRGDMRRRVLRVKKRITIGSFYPDKIRIGAMNREGNDVMVEDEESMGDLTVEVMKQVVIDPTCNSMLDSDSEDSLFNPPSLSPSPPPPETSRHTPSPISILTLPPAQMLREAKMYFKHSILKKSTNDRLTNQDSITDPLIRVEDSDAAFINKAMAPKVSDRRRNSIENELESSMVLKTVSVLHDGMSSRLSNSQIVTSKDSGFTEFSGSKGAIDVDRKEYSSADNLTDARPQNNIPVDRLALHRSVTTPIPKLSQREDPIPTDNRTISPLSEPLKKTSSSPKRIINPPLSSSPDSLDSLRTDSSSGITPNHPLSSLIIFMSSSTCCPHCTRQIYDEEIVTMWGAEDKDFQIRCDYCKKELIPKLTILIQEAIVKETVQKKRSSQVQPTKTFKTLFKKSSVTTEHQMVNRKSSITLQHNHVDATIIPTAYTFGEGPEKLPNAILEDSENTITQLATDLDDDISELQASYDDSRLLRGDANSYIPDDTFQYYRSYTSGVKTLPKRIQQQKRGRRAQLRSMCNPNLPYFDSTSDVRSRIQSVYIEHFPDSAYGSRSRLSTGSSVVSFTDNFSEMLESPLSYDCYIDEDNQSISQFIRDNLEGTAHILFNKDGKENCLPDETNIPFISPIGNLKSDRRLSTTFFPDDNTSDPYLKIKQELASKLETMPLRTGASHSGSSTPSGRGSPDVRPGKFEDYISIPYLSPLVLRKSLENLVNKEGYAFLNSIAFVKRAPFIYWNLVWYFQRLGLRSHLQDIILKCVHYKKCYIETLWEPIGPEMAVPYLHFLWKLRNLNHPFSPTSCHRRIQQVEHILQAISSNVESLELVKAARHILNSRKLDLPDIPSPSLYREMLFLFLVITKDEPLDFTEKLQRYDRHYKQMMSYLPKEYSQMLTPYDYIPSDIIIHCRKIFGPLRVL